MSPEPKGLALADLKLETPERVELSLEVAGLGTRVLAWLVDALIMFLFWTTVSFLASLFTAISPDQLAALSTLAQAGLMLGLFAVQWGYWVTFETLWSGQTPGKRALKIRVVKVDGSPEGFVDAALRSLGRVADFLPAFYATGLVMMVVHPRSRRLGDLLAGTLVVRERKVDLSRYDAPSAPLPSNVTLSAEEYELVTSFLARAPTLVPSARERLAVTLATRLAQKLPETQRAAVTASSAAAEAFLASVVGRRHG